MKPKRFYGLVVFVTAIAAISHGLYKVRSQAGDPVSVELLMPPPGTVYGTSTGLTNIPITVLAGSTAARITRVEIYRDDILINIITNMAPVEVQNLQVTK
jgi:hypothetical protein